MTLEQKLKAKWLPILHSRNRITKKEVAAFKQDLEKLKKYNKDKIMNIQEKIDWTNTRLAKLGKRQNWLAKETGISEGMLSKFLSGKNEITLSKWLRIEEVLK